MSKQKYKSHFQDIWLENKLFKCWLQKHDNIHMARCKVCAKDISVANQGMKALTVHAEGDKHKKRLPIDDQPSISFSKSKNVSSVEIDKSKQTTITTITDKQISTNAEIMWALEIVLCKHSFNSSTNKSNLFCSMFPDSNIAKMVKRNAVTLLRMD